MLKISTFLMFFGQAEEAINLYVSLIPNSAVVFMNKYEEGENAGTVMHAEFTLNGQSFMAIDSPVKHDFTFTPASSIHITCASEEEVLRLYNELSKDGKILMPLDAYPFSKKYAWLNDRFGVSWQINLQ